MPEQGQGGETTRQDRLKHALSGAEGSELRIRTGVAIFTTSQGVVKVVKMVKMVEMGGIRP